MLGSRQRREQDGIPFAGTQKVFCRRKPLQFGQGAENVIVAVFVSIGNVRHPLIDHCIPDRRRSLAFEPEPAQGKLALVNTTEQFNTGSGEPVANVDRLRCK